MILNDYVCFNETASKTAISLKYTYIVTNLNNTFQA